MYIETPYMYMYMHVTLIAGGSYPTREKTTYITWLIALCHNNGASGDNCETPDKINNDISRFETNVSSSVSDMDNICTSYRG